MLLGADLDREIGCEEARPRSEERYVMPVTEAGRVIWITLGAVDRDGRTLADGPRVARAREGGGYIVATKCL